MTLPIQNTLTQANSSFQLSCFEMWLDTIKATKMALDPVSDCAGIMLGCVCCASVAMINAEENDRPATRGDVINARQIQRNQAAEGTAAYRCGFFVANFAVDMTASVIGAVIGGVRASALSLTGNNDSTNNVLSFSREDINDVEIFDSISTCCH